MRCQSWNYYYVLTFSNILLTCMCQIIISFLLRLKDFKIPACHNALLTESDWPYWFGRLFGFSWSWGRSVSFTNIHTLYARCLAHFELSSPLACNLPARHNSPGVPYQCGHCEFSITSCWLLQAAHGNLCWPSTNGWEFPLAPQLWEIFLNVT